MAALGLGVLILTGLAIEAGSFWSFVSRDELDLRLSGKPTRPSMNSLLVTSLEGTRGVTWGGKGSSEVRESLESGELIREINCL